jgi:hypothetical protein
MNGQKCAKTPVKPDRLTKGELLTLYMGIDRQLIRESKPAGAVPADEVMTAFMRLDFSDSSIEEIATLNVNELESLGNVFKRIVAASKAKVALPVLVVKPVAKAVINAAKLVKNTSITPPRANVALALNSIHGPVAKSFLYAFIPANAPELQANPKVKEKRAIQAEAVNKIADELSLDREYVLKHIRNAIVTHYKKNPEAILHDFSTGKEKEFVFNDLGSVDWTGLITAGAGLVTAVAGAATVFKKQSVPTTYDWEKSLPSSRNVTNDPGYLPDPWYKKPLGIVGIGVGVLAIGGGTYYALQD